MSRLRLCCVVVVVRIIIALVNIELLKKVIFEAVRPGGSFCLVWSAVSCIAGIALRISTNFCCSVRVVRSGFVSFGVSAVFPAAVLVELAAAMLITSSH